MDYRTEVHVADDGYICLQLPDFVPRGRAMVTVSFQAIPRDDDDRDDLRSGDPRDADPDDHQDIEWWDDLDG